MRRRDVLSLAAAAAVAPGWPLRALAQGTAKLPRVALCSSATPTASMVLGGDPATSAFLEQMVSHGFVEGRTVSYERYIAPSATAADVAQSIVASAPDLIYWAGAATAGLAALRINKTIPMIIFSSDPVSQGLIGNAAHPGGNITGIATVGSPEFSGKVLGLLCSAIPSAKMVAYVAGGTGGTVSPAVQVHLATARSAAAKLGVSLIPIIVESPGSESLIAAAFAQVAASKADAIQFGIEATVQAWAATEARLALGQKVPAISPYDNFAPAGGLLGYSADFADLEHKAADYAALVLNGAKPGDLPLLQATVYNLVINLKTAKSIGVDIPVSLLAQATEVIQ